MRRAPVVFALVGLLSGCDSGESSSERGARAVRLAAYCDNVSEVEAALSRAQAAVPLRGDADAILTDAAKRSSRARDRAVDNAPTQVRGDATSIDEALDRRADTGDAATTRTAEYAEARLRAHQFDVNNCAWNVVTVTATDHRFEGVPATARPGTATFELTNRGTEWHELVVRPRSSTAALGQALAPAGAGAYAVVRLEPGQYEAVCRLPQGTVGDVTGTGPPHETLGMRVEFNVE